MFSAFPDEVSSFPHSEPSLLTAVLWLPPGSLPTNYELYYGFTRFAVELNELDPVLKDLLPPTDARFRPDQRSGRLQSLCRILDNNTLVRGHWDCVHHLFVPSCIRSSPYSLRNTWVSKSEQNCICKVIYTDAYSMSSYVEHKASLIFTKCLKTQVLPTEVLLSLCL